MTVFLVDLGYVLRNHRPKNISAVNRGRWKSLKNVLCQRILVLTSDVINKQYLGFVSCNVLHLDAIIMALL